MIRHRGIELDRKKLTISHAGHTLKCRRGENRKFMVFRHLILGGGLSTHQLFQLIYGDDPDGGPLDGPHIFLVNFNAWAYQFDLLNLDLVKTTTANVMFYELRPSILVRKPDRIATPKDAGRSHVAAIIAAGL